MTAKHQIEKLALSVATKAMEKDTSLHDQIDALKVLNPYYIALTRAKKKGDEDTDEPSFADLTRNIEDHANGSTEIRARRGRTGPATDA